MSSISLSTKFSLLALLMVALLAAMAGQAQAKAPSVCKNHPQSDARQKGHHHKGHNKGQHKGHKGHNKGHNKGQNKGHNKGHNKGQNKSPSPSGSSSGHNTHSKGNGKYGPTPPKGKAGVAGGNSLKWTSEYLGWYTDWTPNPNNPNAKGIESVPMLWGLGRVGHDDDRARFEAFKKLKPGSSPYVIGFNEADFSGSGSSGLIPPEVAAAGWDRYIAPHGEAGSLLISPSCAKQKDENWLQPFLNKVKRQPDMINVHIFQKSIEGVKGVLDHYAKYNKPMWITEFACINYQVQPTQYCSQQETDRFLSEAIKLFENDDRVAAYAVSDAYNGPVSALTPNHSGKTLSTTGKVFLSQVKSVAINARRSLLRRVRRSAVQQQ